MLFDYFGCHFAFWAKMIKIQQVLGKCYGPFAILYLFIAAIALRQWPSSAPGQAHVPDHNEGGGPGAPSPPVHPWQKNKNN